MPALFLKYSNLKLKIGFILLIIIIRAALDYYFNVFSDDFAYYGMIWMPRTILEIFISYLIVTSLAFSLEVKTSRPSSFIHLILFLVCFIPASTYYALNSTTSSLAFYGLASTFALVPITSKVINLIPSVRPYSLSKLSYRNALIFLFLGGLSYIVAAKGFKNGLPSLTEVYSQRDDFKASTGALERYIIDWMANAINIAVLLYGLTYRKYFWAIASILVAFYLYSLGGHKSFLFGVFIVAILFGIIFIFKSDLNIISTMGLCTFLIAVFILDSLSEKNYTLVSSLFIRRTLLLPSQIFYHYCDYFTLNELNYFSQNFPFRSFLNSPYSDKIPEIIGREYFGFKEDVYANGNVFADTFSNIGYASFPFLGIILPVIYAISDWCVKNKPMVFSVSFVFMISHTLLNSGLIVTFITHGLLIGLVLASLHPPIPNKSAAK